MGASREVQVQGRTLMMHRVDETTVTAFTNVCTHQGCLLQVVDRQEGPAYACPCHGSHFDVTSGKPFGGPARQALMDYDAAVVDDRIVVKL
ncbi:Rieske (2Fe-2S) protein [Micrococcus luteus]|uniref:Rieske (2Fe-2S) protein n=1 Tax=Micrococcus luteus TaxID=1270 RepID=UPI0020CD0869|nr:Rieske (2Fe-2S) protein [Micrococcus luteus]UTT44726.1 Rieske (2Fe-2S) protein [Micrococcus luteus]